MKLIPFSVIKAAKENDPEAAEKIRKHYDIYWEPLSPKLYG